jgi:hypothetical protein
MDKTEALRRIRLITPMMRKDVETADLSSLVMGAANNAIPKGLEGTFTPFTNIYLAGQNALTLKLAMDLRIFDLSEGRPAEAQDKASIPVLAALLTRPDVRDGLLQDAAKWIAGIKIGYPAGSPPPDFLRLTSSLPKRAIDLSLPTLARRQSRTFSLSPKV